MGLHARHCWPAGIGWVDLHHSAAKHGDTNHESPAGDGVHDPQDITHSGGEAVLGQLSVVRVEEPVMQLSVGPVAILVQLDEVVRGHGGHVEALGVDVDRGRGGQDLEDPEGAGGGGPGVAEDGLVVAVDQGGMGAVGLKGEFGGCLVESLLDSVTMACYTTSASRVKRKEGRGKREEKLVMPRASHSPKQVLFPPVNRTHHSTGSVVSGVTGPKRVLFQLFKVKMSRFRDPALASAAPTGSCLLGFGM